MQGLGQACLARALPSRDHCSNTQHAIGRHGPPQAPARQVARAGWAGGSSAGPCSSTRRPQAGALTADCPAAGGPRAAAASCRPSQWRPPAAQEAAARGGRGDRIRARAWAAGEVRCQCAADRRRSTRRVRALGRRPFVCRSTTSWAWVLPLQPLLPSDPSSPLHPLMPAALPLHLRRRQPRSSGQWSRRP